MSGFDLPLYSTRYYQRDESGEFVLDERGQKIVVDADFPDVTANDRNEAILAMKMAGYDRGVTDGYAAAKQQGNRRADAIPIKHMLFHQRECIKRMTSDLAPTSLSASTLRKTWTEGYAEGLIMGYEMLKKSKWEKH